MFYLRSDSLSAQCEGETDAFVVDLQGTTCAEVRAGTRSSDLLTTAFMALINIGFLGTTAALMVRLWSTEAAARAPDGLLARSLRRASAPAAALQVHHRRSSAAPGDEGKVAGSGGSDAGTFAAINNPMVQRSRAMRAGTSVRFVLPPAQPSVAAALDASRTSTSVAAALHASRTSSRAASGRGRATLGALGLPAPAPQQRTPSTGKGEDAANGGLAGRSTRRFAAEPLGTGSMASAATAACAAASESEPAERRADEDEGDWLEVEATR
jgi:hypothetical protein